MNTLWNHYSKHYLHPIETVFEHLDNNLKDTLKDIFWRKDWFCIWCGETSIEDLFVWVRCWGSNFVCVWLSLRAGIIYCTILDVIILYYHILSILYYTVCHYTILPYYSILYYTTLYYPILHYGILYYTILFYTTRYCVDYATLYYAVVYCTILYCVWIWL